MGLPGTIDSAVYEGLRDVLQRYPVVTTVAYEPDSIVKKSLRAQGEPVVARPPPCSGSLDCSATTPRQRKGHASDPRSGERSLIAR